MIPLGITQAAVIGDPLYDGFEPCSCLERRPFGSPVEVDVEIDLELANIVFHTRQLGVDVGSLFLPGLNVPVELVSYDGHLS